MNESYQVSNNQADNIPNLSIRILKDDITVPKPFSPS